MAREFNVLALIKGEERYIFVYDEASREALLNAFRDQAADPRLSLTWFDAAVLTDKAREQDHSSQSAHVAHDVAHELAHSSEGDEPQRDSKTRARF